MIFIKFKVKSLISILLGSLVVTSTTLPFVFSCSSSKDETVVNNQEQNIINKEVSRIENLNLKLDNQELSQNDFNLLNEKNILSNINFVQEPGFTYIIEDFSKNDQEINFKIRVRSNNPDKNGFIFHGVTKNIKIKCSISQQEETPSKTDLSIFDKEDIINRNEMKYDDFVAMNQFSFTDSGPKTITLNNNVYDGNNLLVNKYSGSNPVFRYPAWNNSYKEESNRYIDFNGNKIDLKSDLLNERTQDGQKYNDYDFIISEIDNNRLKKHPSADLMYEMNWTKINQSVDRTFDISTAYPGNYATGLWAPAGQVIEIQFDEITFKKLKETNFEGIVFDINHNFWDNKEANDSGGISTRYPYIKTEFRAKLSRIDEATRTLKIGSPFGGNIVVYLDKWLTGNVNKKSNNVKFTIKNAIKSLYYVHNKTTKQEWDLQMDEVRLGKIAPSFDGVFAYGSMNIPFTRGNEIGHVNLDEIEYPNETFSKLTDFLFLSNYFNSRDIHGNIRRLDFQFSDDVWGGAAGWGGSDALYAASDSGSHTFLKGVNEFGWWSFSKNWLVFHEINHNFQVDNTMFKWIEENNHMHPRANEVNLFDFAMQGDMGRWRNTWNFYGENNRLKPGYNGNNPSQYNNQFAAIAHFREPYYNKPKDPTNIDGEWTGCNTDDNTLYSLIMNTVGPKRYADYIRWSSMYHNTDNPNYTYMGEIEQFSKFFGINLWPAINKLTNMKWQSWSPFWLNGASGPKQRWPENYNSATKEEKSMIDNLSKNYKTVDFVGNLFASGSYIYNQYTNDFDYTGDTVPAYEIAPGRPYTFDFKNYIVSMNPNFKWDKLEFSQPKYGKLASDPNDSENKRLIYTPSIENIGDIDEFDLTIYPSNFAGKESNYVPAYKWKIKIRQNVSSAHFKMTTTFDDQQLWNDSDEMFDRINQTEILGEWEYGDIRQWCFDDISKKWKKQGLNTKFRFVALKDGNYEFNFDWGNAARFKIDGKETFRKVNPEQSGYWNVGKYQYTKQMKKGDSLLFDIDVISNNNTENNMDAPGMLDMNVKLDGFNISYIANLLSPFVDDLNIENNYIDYLTKEKYLYKPRKIDYDVFGSDASISKFMDVFEIPEQNSDYDVNKFYYRTNGYHMDDKDYEWGCNNQFFNEDLHSDNWYMNDIISKNKEYDVWIDELSQPLQMQSITFAHNTSHHGGMNAIPNDYLVTITNEADEEIVVYDGKNGNIGSEYVYYPEWYMRKEVILFDKPYIVKKIKIRVINDVEKETYFSRIIFSKDSSLPPLSQSYLTFNNNKVMLDKNWFNIKNNPQHNIGNFNESSFYSSVKGSKIEFDLFGVDGFGISGRGDINDSTFDVLINGELVGSSLKTNNTMEFNKTLYINLGLDPNKNYKITLIQKEDKPLFLNYIAILNKKILN